MSTVAEPLSEAGRSKSTRLGIGLCLMSMFVFAAQDGITKILVKDLPVSQLIMVRYWFFLLFALCLVHMKGGLRSAVKSGHPWLQLSRSLIAVFDIMVFGLALRFLGLAETHAIYAIFPLLTMGLAALLLGEKVSPRQCVAGLIGFAGTLIILQPGMGVFSVTSLIPLVGAVMFAFFSVLTRKISAVDSFSTNMLHMGFWGALASTVVATPQWVTPSSTEWGLLLVLSVSGVIAQLLLLQSLKYAAAVTLQPFNYSLLLFASVFGVTWFGETLATSLVIGALLVVLGGIYAFRR